MNMREYVSIVKNPYMNLEGFDKSKCCHNLMINGYGDWYCDKHQKIIGYGKDGTLRAMMYCQFYYRDHNCWHDLNDKAQKEEAEKSRAEAEKKEREERAFFEKIITDFNNAILQTPNDAENYRLRGGAYAQIKEYEKAIADYNEAIRLNPNDAEAYAFRGSVYTQKKEFNQALDDLNEAIRLNPNCKNAYWFRGAMYGVKDEHDKSISDYEEALRIDPNDNTTKTFLENARRLKEDRGHWNRKKNDRKTRKRNRILLGITLGLISGIIFGTLLLFLYVTTGNIVFVFPAIGAVFGGIIGKRHNGIMEEFFNIIVGIIIGGIIGIIIGVFVKMLFDYTGSFATGIFVIIGVITGTIIGIKKAKNI